MPTTNPIADYWLDAWQRSVLTLDVLRQRGNIYYEHNAMNAPNVLTFKDLGIEPSKVTEGFPIEHLRHYRVGGYDFGAKSRHHPLGSMAPLTSLHDDGGSKCRQVLHFCPSFGCF